MILVKLLKSLMFQLFYCRNKLFLESKTMITCIVLSDTVDTWHDVQEKKWICLTIVVKNHGCSIPTCLEVIIPWFVITPAPPSPTEARRLGWVFRNRESFSASKLSSSHRCAALKCSSACQKVYLQCGI